MEPGGEGRHAAGRQPHWVGLDGVRGLAVAAVLAFHGGFAWARGGFLGVSLFFTLSGFLITTILVGEHQSTGRISLTRFWARRARRLLPASIVALGMGLVVTTFVIPSGQRVEALGDIRAAALNFVNWRFIWRGDIYADVTRIASPVQHYWSLAIEEQFYLAFPLLAALALRWRRATLAVVLSAVVVWAVRQQIVIDDSARVYYGTDTRAAELALGGLLALGRPRISALLAARAQLVADLLGGSALLAMLVIWWRVPNSSETLHSGGLAAFGCLSAAVVLGAVEGQRLSAVLSHRLLTGLGLISYGVYLYHFPVFLALTPDRVPLDGPPLFALRVGITLALAAASFHLLERPVRLGARLRSHRSTTAFVGSIAAAVLVTFVAAQRIEDRSQDLAGGVEVTLGATPTSVTDGRPPHVVLVGDSTAATMGRGLQTWGSATGRLQVTTVTSPGCATLFGEQLKLREGYTFRPKGCDVLFSTAAAVAGQQRVDAIVVWIGSSQLGDWTYPGARGWRDITDDGIQRSYRQALDVALTELESVGVPVLWADLPTPAWDLDAFGEYLGAPLPGHGPVLTNDPRRAGIVNAIDAATIAERRTTVHWRWSEVLAGPDGEIEPGLRFDGLHVAEDRIDALAEGGLMAMLEAAYDEVVARHPRGLRQPADHLWSAGHDAVLAQPSR